MMNPGTSQPSEAHSLSRSAQHAPRARPPSTAAATPLSFLVQALLQENYGVTPRAPLILRLSPEPRAFLHK
eukprot:scaffold210100_cov26-Tisochrysis_lutea.AAC.1